MSSPAGIKKPASAVLIRCLVGATLKALLRCWSCDFQIVIVFSEIIHIYIYINIKQASNRHLILPRCQEKIEAIHDATTVKGHQKGRDTHFHMVSHVIHFNIIIFTYQNVLLIHFLIVVFRFDDSQNENSYSHERESQ